MLLFWQQLLLLCFLGARESKGKKKRQEPHSFQEERAKTGLNKVIDSVLGEACYGEKELMRRAQGVPFKLRSEEDLKRGSEDPLGRGAAGSGPQAERSTRAC